MTLSPLGDYLKALRADTPLVHCITNYVAMNSTANLLLAIGASPAMLHAQEEVAEFTALSGALSVNIGTISPHWADAILTATATANQHAIPWVLDPVAVGATRYRQTLCAKLLAAKPTVIRGNASEILTLDGLTSQGRGPDSTAATEQAVEAAITLSKKHGCIVAMTGESDWVTDGTHHYRLTGGHPLMPRVTTLGCGLSALVAAFVAANHAAPLGASAAALACFAVAGQRAGNHAQGPGSFQVALLDALYQLSPDDLSHHAQLETTHAV
ncbi:hydroxyethylthiazole kinase [Halovibrio sp. HP20-50]|uniref:hydroxyethylthiazole kinase n=1 Tax=Halovibrio sp. HP20-59 TaxID=3080275 RepID=UPI00294B0096|nr:hydroxyethylthiazole kinase [Halovibrio sp. HP20-59]MEA2119591.1 hydroxyethylthiazole kinase [Halovibrio sp. HP20-59]